MRNYKCKVGARKYRDFTNASLNEAVQTCRSGQMTIREASDVYKIPRATLARRVQSDGEAVGRPTVLSEEEEILLCEHLTLVAEWGYPLTRTDLRYMVKDYLDKKGVNTRFPDNMPGVDWALLFLNRRKQLLSTRLANNIKRARANVDPKAIEQYFKNLEDSLRDVPLENIHNYDETNLSDDPGRKKVIAKRGVKYVDVAWNSKNIKYINRHFLR